jgi:hypothetical protein
MFLFLFILLLLVLFVRVREGLEERPPESPPESPPPPVENPLDKLTGRVKRIEDWNLDQRLKKIEDDIKSFGDS